MKKGLSAAKLDAMTTPKADPSYGTMFSSVLRRPRHASQRVNSRELSVSPASGPLRRRQFTTRTHATADFTEADDDDDDDTNEEGLVHFDEDGQDEHGGDEDDDDAEDDEENEDDDDAIHAVDEDNRRKALPVLPLFSSTHLGKSSYTYYF